MGRTGTSAPFRALGKIRYAAREAACTVYPDGDSLRVEFDDAQRAVTAGQAWYFTTPKQANASWAAASSNRKKEEDSCVYRSYQKLFNHRTYRPWQIDAGRPDAGNDRHRAQTGNGRPAPRYDGSRTGTGHYHQSPVGPSHLRCQRWQTVYAQSHRHAGHVDFNYEVSRSLAACEGALLIVDATQASKPRPWPTFYLALEHDLEIIPIINKVDLPSADPDRVCKEIEDVIGLDASDAIMISAKTGYGVDKVLEAIVQRIPHRLTKGTSPCGPLSSTPTSMPIKGLSPTSASWKAASSRASASA